MKRLNFNTLLSITVISAVLLFTLLGGQCQNEKKSPLTWKQCLNKPQEWYGSQEARRIADNVLLYQLDIGGWPKNLDMAAPLDEAEKQKLQDQKGEREDATIDNSATHTQIRFLSRVYQSTQDPLYIESVEKGLDFLFAAQYENGGWPQFPYRKGYYSHITYNDNAMIGVMRLLRDIADGKEPFGFVDEGRKDKSRLAVEKGIQCILKTQVEINSVKTAWCAQHDEHTLEPAPARAYEKISISGAESAGITQFLMDVPDPSPEIIEAVEAAVKWFEEVKLTGIKVEEVPDASLPKGYDKVVVPDPTAPPLWARFYEIGTNRPIFCGRDGIVKYNLAEIEPERRTGYAWYSDSAAEVLKKYPKWKEKLKEGK